VARSIRDAGHLPKQSADGRGADPYELPRQRRGVTPQLHGRYPDYDVLENAEHWDEVTRSAVVARVREVPPVRFFDAAQERCLRAFLDVLLAQDAEPRVPVFEMVDAKMHDGKLDGFQFEDMPDDRDTWRIVARGLDQEARERGLDNFAAAPDDVRRMICGAFNEGDVSGGVWDEVNVSNAWSVVMRHITQAFYSHPWSWNEIGFGGPAYPRGYARLGIGQREWWEGKEAFERDPVSDTKERGIE
jgi:gluconate 2-dehydrogenase subunit 3-like protein